MLAAVAIVPGSPSLVPALTGPAADLDAPRVAVRRLGERLARVAPTRWIALCTADVHDPEPVGDTGIRHGDLPTNGTYLGFGVDVRVRLVPGTPPAAVADRLPTTVLTAAWLRGETAPDVTVDPVVVVPSLDGAGVAVATGLVTDLLADEATPTGLLVVADGSTGLTVKAPGGLIEGAEAIQETVDTAVARGDLDAITALDVQGCAHARVDGRAVLQIAAAVWRAAGHGPPVAESLWHGAPFGVGAHVAWWGIASAAR
ncbi:hypothetical protein [uncultured Williamsia sp.]|uniref:hypothetical protein n=1 Tax=uncultured Williamsia sp. TaxID=259311 RepID=UPI002623B4CE|nr:hypothetical protein [uncultured Williamsia sp.]